MIDSVISYAERGWAVHALEERSKEPATRRGFKDATTNVTALKRLWGDYPNLNVSIATGAVSGGLLVIDLDVDEDKGKDGVEWLSEWEAENGKLPETACVVTGRGGSHLYYRTDRDIRNHVNPDIGVDIRCNGGYVMAPPSVHPNGNEVYWDLSPDDVGVADANSLVYKLVEDVSRGSSDDTPFEPMEIVEKGGRNDHLYRFCASQRARSTAKADCLEYAMAYNKNHFQPPLSYREVKTVVNSAYTKPAGLSEEAKKAKESSIAKASTTSGSTNKAPGRPKKFEHNKVAKSLIDDMGACIVDGIPAIRKDGRYVPGWDAFDSEVYKMRDDATTSNIREVKHYIGAMAPKKSQSSINLIAFRNGVLDISDMSFRDATDDDVILNVIPHDYNPNVQENIADEFLDGLALGDLATTMNLHETIGMCLARDSVKTPYCPTLIGTGRNGKSTFINMLRYVVGDENISSINPSDISAHFQAVSIVGKTANLSDDIPGGYLDHSACSAIKKIATGDSIHTDVKHSDGFDFRPYCTMVFSANDFPRMADTSHGMMRRLHPVEFRARFEPGTPGADVDMADKVMTEEAAQRFIVLGVEALRRLRATGKMTDSDASGRIKDEMMLDNNSVLQWVRDNGGPEFVHGMTKDEAFENYSDWAGRNGFAKTMVNSCTMSAQLKGFFGLYLCTFGVRQVGLDRKRVRVFGQKGENQPE